MGIVFLILIVSLGVLGLYIGHLQNELNKRNLINTYKRLSITILKEAFTKTNEPKAIQFIKHCMLVYRICLCLFYVLMLLTLFQVITWFYV
jgi:hypothetical protein